MNTESSNRAVLFGRIYKTYCRWKNLTEHRNRKLRKASVCALKWTFKATLWRKNLSSDSEKDGGFLKLILRSLNTNANAEFPHEAAHSRICVLSGVIWLMISRKRLCCWVFKRARRQTTPWTMSWKLTLKQSRWSNSTTGPRKNVYFWLIFVNCPFKEWNVRKIQCRSSMEKCRPTAQRRNIEVQQMLKMTLYICTKVSALRNISGKSWVTIHPAHTETIRNTHSEKVQSQIWRGMRKCFTDVQVTEMLQRRPHFPTNCVCVCVADESARRTRYWKEEDQSESRDQPLTVRRGPKQFLSLFFVLFLRWCISGTPSQSENTGLGKKKKVRSTL